MSAPFFVACLVKSTSDSIDPLSLNKTPLFTQTYTNQSQQAAQHQQQC